MRQEVSDAALASIGVKTTLSGVASSGIAILTSIELFSYVGFFLALIGVLINWYYKRKDDRRKQAELALKRADDARKEAEHQAIIKHLRDIRRDG